jgi:hypothetical protein
MLGTTRSRGSGALSIGLCLAAAPGVAAADTFTAPDPVEQTHVYGGNAVSACAWPTTVSLGGCTGTLVHPEVVIYAAHCGSVSQVFLGDSVGSQGRTLSPAFCKTYPGGGPGGGTDWAFCKLSQPVTDVPVTPPLMGCETDRLQGGAEVHLVGFGNTDDGNFGVKYEAKTTFNYIQNDEAFIGGGGVDTCQGDSGGPVFIELDDGTWRAFGITSYGDGCGGGGWYSMMHTGMQWFESESGVDITPCHDADGTWSPGPDCQGFPLDSDTGSGSWPNACSFGEVGGYSSTCGAPYLAQDDTDPPTVRIGSPGDGASLHTESGGTAELEVTITADDGDGSGVREVQLLLDGTAIGGPMVAPPFVYRLDLGAGSYALQAVAVDHGENTGESELVRIGIDMDPPEDPPDGTSGGDADGDEGEDDDGDGGSGGTLPGGGALPPDYGLGAPDTSCACRTRGGGAGALPLLCLALLWRRRRPFGAGSRMIASPACRARACSACAPSSAAR